MPVYLIHFEKKYGRMGHYCGFSKSEKTLPARIAHHRAGTGSRWLAFMNQLGIGWKVVRVWNEGDKNFERKLKRRKKLRSECPVCKGRVCYEEIEDAVQV